MFFSPFLLWEKTIPRHVPPPKNRMGSTLCGKSDTHSDSVGLTDRESHGFYPNFCWIKMVEIDPTLIGLLPEKTCKLSGIFLASSNSRISWEIRNYNFNKSNWVIQFIGGGMWMNVVDISNYSS